MSKADHLSDLVRIDDGLISPEIFIDEQIYRAELERLFGRTWLFLAHDSMIPKPGDFFSTYMGSDPVIVARQDDGSVRAYLNSCRHRGMKVCRAEDGNTRSFMCTYHGWAYDKSGALLSVPSLHDAYFDELDLVENGLVQVRVETYRGLIFGNFDAAAPSLDSYLGGMKFWIDGWLDQTEGGIEFLPGVVKWTINGNWKLGAEQFAGDTYHAAFSHASTPMGEMLSQMTPEFAAGFAQACYPEGHTTVAIVQEAPISRVVDDDELMSYKFTRQIEAASRVGERASIGNHFTVFPNFSGLASLADLRVWHPKGPNKFEIWKFTFVDRDAPESVKQAQAVSAGLTEGPAGTIESDDGENWDLIGRVLHAGHQVRKVPWNYQMGLNHDSTDEHRWGGLVNEGRAYSETAQRVYYRRWLEFMTSAEWPHVQELAEDMEALR